MPALYGYSEGYFEPTDRRPRDLREVLELKNPTFAYTALLVWNQTWVLDVIRKFTTWPVTWQHKSHYANPDPIVGSRLRLNRTALFMMGTDLELQESLWKEDLSAIISDSRLGIHHVSIKNKKERRIILIIIAPLSEYWGSAGRFPGNQPIEPYAHPDVYHAGRGYWWHTLTQHTIQSIDPAKPTGFTLRWLSEEVIPHAHNFEPWFKTKEKGIKIEAIDAQISVIRGAPPPTTHPPDQTKPHW